MTEDQKLWTQGVQGGGGGEIQRLPIVVSSERGKSHWREADLVSSALVSPSPARVNLAKNGAAAPDLRRLPLLGPAPL